METLIGQGDMGKETWTWIMEHRTWNMDMETWSHGHGDTEMVTWSWRHGDGHMVMETRRWRWSYGHGDTEMDTWFIWTHGRMETWRH